jgi:hypothetical protein
VDEHIQASQLEAKLDMNFFVLVRYTNKWMKFISMNLEVTSKEVLYN